MDVRCEKCQTEYELDEARLKPGGVTVKCTHCGHMFKIRKRANTNVGAPPPAETRAGTASTRPATRADSAPNQHADSLIGEDTVVRPAINEDPTDVRQWLIRLESGEQKSCRELAILQQWIVAGVVTRESLISRTGKTWKRLGDIAELSQYFAVGEEARTTRQDRSTKPAPKEVQSTVLGFGASAAGGTIVPDDEDEIRTTFKSRRSTTPPPLPQSAPRSGVRPQSSKTPPMGSGSNLPAIAPPTRRPLTQPPPPPAKRPQSQSEPLPAPPPAPERPRGPSVPAGNRSTAAWATDGVSPQGAAIEEPRGPLGGKLSAIPDEPAFAGRVRMIPSDEARFQTGKVKALDDDEELLPERRGSRGGMWILLMALLVMGAAATVIYVFVIRKAKPEQVVKAPADAALVATVADASPPVITPVIDAPAAPVMTPVDVARGELPADNEPRLRDALKSLEGSADPGALALKAHLGAAIAQGLIDRATVTPDKADAAKLRKDAETVLLDAAVAAEKAVKATPDDAASNLAMAEVLRMKAKPARDVKRYLDKAKLTATAGWTREVALADALLLFRETKLEDARAAFTALDQGEDKLEASGDVRARFHLALVHYAQNKPADAKPLVEQVLAAQPEHAGAKALAARIETTVAKTDQMPPEDPPKDGGTTAPKPKPTPEVAVGGDSYDRLLARANTIAESSCGKAMELYAKALEQKPNGVEALTGMGYCHIDAKQFASAFSKFRAALAVSSRYEPALWGVAEAYQQQGRKEQAIEAFKAYLEIYPGTAKAQKQLDRLTLDSGGASAPAPAPTPAPTPPTPAPAEGSGSGSG